MDSENTAKEEKNVLEPVVLPPVSQHTPQDFIKIW